ncbi:MAG TPA: zinc-ribbon domain-containing protein [Reyranella sp.]|nr:zinc-ribbon domain-containing protein [Reyranella sp.]
MIVTCPNCEARYAVDPLAIGPAGRTVQCARCDNRWFQRVESPRTAPDLVIRPPARDAAPSTLPVPIPTTDEPRAWGRIIALVVTLLVVLALAGAGYYFRSDVMATVSTGTEKIKALIASATSSSSTSSSSTPAAKPPAPPAPKTEPKAEAKPAPPPAAAPPAATPPAATPAPPAEKAQLEVDLSASKVELVDGKYVVHGQVVNKGKAEGSTRLLKFTFKKNKEVVGEKSYPLVLGPIAPGARLDFSQTLDDPPAGATEIVPAVE